MKWLILFLLLCPFSLASQFYSGWVYPGDTFEAQGSIYTVSGDDPYTIALSKDDTTYVINYGDCQDSFDGQERYCYIDSDYVDCEREEYTCPDSNPSCCPYDVSHIDFRAGKAVWGTYLTLESITPDFTITRSVDESSLFVNQDAKLKIVVKNNGEDAVTGIVIKERLPDGFLYLSGDLTKNGNILSKKFNLNPNQQAIFIYTVRAQEFVDGHFTGNVTYNHKGKQVIVQSGTTTISVPKPFEMTGTLTANSVKIQEAEEYRFKIENIDEDNDLEVDVVFTGLEKIVTSKPSDVERDDDRYLYSARLGDEESETLRFDIRSDVTGIFNITANATMRLGTEIFNHAITSRFTVTIDELKPVIKSSPEVLIANEPATIWLYLDNVNGDDSFSTVRATVEGPRVQKSLTFDGIAPGDTPLIEQFNIIAPLDDATYTFKGTYKSVAGEVFAFDYIKTIAVDDSDVQGEHVITQQLNQTILYPNDSVEITVRVKNYYREYRDITIKEILPFGFQTIGGVTEKEMSLNKDEEREAYKYRLRIPADFASDHFIVKTEVVDRADKEIYPLELNISVAHRAPPPEEVVEETVDETAPPQQETQQEEEPGFWSRIWNSIVSIFS